MLISKTKASWIKRQNISWSKNLSLGDFTIVSKIHSFKIEQLINELLHLPHRIFQFSNWFKFTRIQSISIKKASNFLFCLKKFN